MTRQRRPTLESLRIDGVRLVPWRRQLAAAVADGRNEWIERTGWFVIVESDGVRGIGEAAPLPGYVVGGGADAEARARRAALRFALETAILDAEARKRGVRFANLIADAALALVPVNAVVRDVEGARAAFARGIRTLKVKVGADHARTMTLLRAIRVALPEAALRVDANQTWPLDEVETRLADLAELRLDYVEEPAAGLAARLRQPLPVPVALDESLAAPDRETWLDQALASGALAAIVLKPTVLGGITICRRLAARAQAHGLAVNITHSLEGPVALAACAELARALSLKGAVGLDRHAFLATWSLDVPQLTDDAVVPATASGLGIDIDAAIAAADAPVPAPAAILDTGMIAIPAAAIAAAMARETFATPLVAGLDADSVAAIGRALDEHRPIGLIQDRLPQYEQAALASRLAKYPVPEDTAVVVFTSGSTGHPKGVVISRTALDAAVAASAAHLGTRADDRWLLALPPAHIAGFGVIARSRALGVPPVIGDAGSTAPATLVSMVPAQLARLLEDAAWTPPPTWRAVLLGGAAAATELVARARARGVPVLTTYGMSETTGQIATCPPGQTPPEGAVGVPLPGIHVDAGTREAPAVVRVRTPAAFTRYLDETRADPDAVVTTDLGFLEDGWLHVVGRADDVIVTGGEKVHPLTVENALARIPGVVTACVVGIPDPTWGQLVAAAIVPAPGHRKAIEASLEKLAHALAPHARPRHVVFVDALPLGPTGKVDRAAVATQLASSR
ncbi:MAG TPA: enolase C-terminal domain-like protein [Kofleriaceae bacterium]|nr:enolase C-terminal domain-like protein [Kofleriaceae bacterium]